MCIYLYMYIRVDSFPHAFIHRKMDSMPGRMSFTIQILVRR